MGTVLKLKASDGVSIGAYRADPAGKARGALIVCQEIFGVNRHIRSVCDRYAASGYVALAPAFFDRVEAGVELGYTPDDIARGRSIMQKVKLDDAMLDVKAALDALTAVGKVGIVGYCWGGTVSWAAATRVSGLACSAPYYGGGIAGLASESPRCPVEMHFGETDHAIPMTDVDKVRAAQPGVAFFVYPAGHGFNCDERGSYDAACAKLATERTLAQLAKHVG
jgi:carboxymethylenebutenolidase